MAMTLHGADVYLRSDVVPDLPRVYGPFALLFIANRGTRLQPGSADMQHSDWPQCRFFSETAVSDEEVDELIGYLTHHGFQWTKLQKLFRIDGSNAFSQPY